MRVIDHHQDILPIRINKIIREPEYVDNESDHIVCHVEYERDRIHQESFGFFFYGKLAEIGKLDLEEHEVRYKHLITIPNVDSLNTPYIPTICRAIISEENISEPITLDDLSRYCLPGDEGFQGVTIREMYTEVGVNYCRINIDYLIWHEILSRHNISLVINNHSGIGHYELRTERGSHSELTNQLYEIMVRGLLVYEDQPAFILTKPLRNILLENYELLV